MEGNKSASVNLHIKSQKRLFELIETRRKQQGCDPQYLVDAQINYGPSPIVEQKLKVAAEMSAKFDRIYSEIPRSIFYGFTASAASFLFLRSLGRVSPLQMGLGIPCGTVLLAFIYTSFRGYTV
mmetsp:Transcript_37305/g.42355  ORF Transcript_37305/g.42355 Transcript_37305/m.42355 type:complete len:124 (-) Transcript_37305:300-671(-)